MRGQEKQRKGSELCEPRAALGLGAARSQNQPRIRGPAEVPGARDLSTRHQDSKLKMSHTFPVSAVRKGKDTQITLLCNTEGVMVKSAGPETSPTSSETAPSLPGCDLTRLLLILSPPPHL